MTRAADRLIVCGADGRTKRPERCWYDLVRGPLEAFLVEEDDGDEKVLRFRKTPTDAVRRPPAAGSGKDRAARTSGVAATTGARRSAASPRRCRRRRPSTKTISLIAPSAGSAARSAKGAGARPAGASADASRCPIFRPSAAQDAAERYLANAATDFSRPSGPRWRGKCSPSSTIRSSPKSLRREAAPRCRSSAALRARGETRSRSPARSTAWPSPATRC